MVIHHGLSTKEVVFYLGMVVGFELHGGAHAEGRVVAVDAHNVYLSRTRDHTISLHDIKRIDKFP